MVLGRYESGNPETDSPLRPVQPPRSWVEPTGHFLALLESDWYRGLVRLQDAVTVLTTSFWAERGVRNLHLPITTGSISSPMGRGGREEPEDDTGHRPRRHSPVRPAPEQGAVGLARQDRVVALVGEQRAVALVGQRGPGAHPRADRPGRGEREQAREGRDRAGAPDRQDRVLGGDGQHGVLRPQRPHAEQGSQQKSSISPSARRSLESTLRRHRDFTWIHRMAYVHW